MRTDAAEVIDRFAAHSERARSHLDRWKADPHKAEVLPYVLGHVVEAFYDQGPGDVERVCRETEHALGEAKRSVAESVTSIRDWHPPFAFTHALHAATEASGTLPTYQGFREWCRDDPTGQRMLWEPAQTAVKSARAEGSSQDHAGQAMRWRIGNAYYSFVREAWVTSVLRTEGWDIRLHPLADALFRVDFWSGNTNISLFVGNPRFRAASGGRKQAADQLLRDARPRFAFGSIELETQHRFGVVHLPMHADVLTATTLLERATL